MKLSTMIPRIGAASAMGALAVLAAVLAVDGGSAGSPVAPVATETAAPRFGSPRTIDNPYLPITTRRQCTQRGWDHDGTRTKAVQTVLRRTKRFRIGGQAVDAVVVRDNSYSDGKLVETAFDYFAQADNGTVYYLGEDVDNVRNWKVIDHEGTWLLGRHTDVPGVAMPAKPEVGDQYRFEDVPGVTSESNRVEETGMRAKVGGRLYTGVIRIQEFIQPEGEIEYKLYAPGVGQITEYPPGGRAEFSGCR